MTRWQAKSISQEKNKKGTSKFKEKEEVKEKEELVLNLARATTDFATYESVMLGEAGYTVYYGKNIGNVDAAFKRSLEKCSGYRTCT